MPTTSSVSVRLTRRFTLGSNVNVDPIFEIFNLFNRTNFTGINNIFGLGSYPSAPAPTYGQFEQAGPPRQIQLALKVSF
jgi:hypothetical protein